MNNPIEMRNRVLEIDRTIRAMQQERSEIAQKLHKMGFQLIGVFDNPVVPEPAKMREVPQYVLGTHVAPLTQF